MRTRTPIPQPVKNIYSVSSHLFGGEAIHTNNKGNSPTLPAAEIHERMVQPRQEGAVVLVMVFMSLMLGFMVRVIMMHI
jgi:hypothetical protein